MTSMTDMVDNTKLTLVTVMPLIQHQKAIVVVINCRQVLVD
jgi:hypothetical protein